MSEPEEDDGGGIPEWVVTFGDMMSLLLTFFIMLVSLSEIKQEEKYQAMVESMRRRFGYDRSLSSMVPGRSKPRNAKIARLATAGRAKRLDVMRGGNPVQSAVGDFPKVRIVRPGTRTTIGSVIPFQPTQVELDDAQRKALDQTLAEMRGKPQVIEVRGHTTPHPVAPETGFHDHWSLAFARCRAVFNYLTKEQNIDPRRIRISVAGPNEPLTLQPDLKQQRMNSRVEVFMLDEAVSDLAGTREEKQQRFTEEQP